MRITLFISSLYGGGAERVTCNLANYLVQHGYVVDILTMAETAESYELDRHVSVVSLLPIIGRKNKLWNTLVRFPRLWRYMRTHQQDAYVVMLPVTTIMLLFFRKLTKAKVVAAERVDPAVYPLWMGKSLKLLAKRADAFVFQTEEAKAWYGESVRNIKTAVIPNAINPAFIRHPYQGEKRKIIAGAGRLNDQKNFSLLIRAFGRIAADFPNYNLVIYGEGNKRDALEKQVNAMGLQERVFLPGNIQNIAEEMEQNSAFVLSSDYEGMPNALMEAMALGLPCISTDCPCGGPRFLIQNGENGILVPVGDEEKMAESMRHILDDSKLRESISAKAIEIQDRLAPEKIYGEWEAFIERVCED